MGGLPIGKEYRAALALCAFNDVPSQLAGLKGVSQ